MPQPAACDHPTAPLLPRASTLPASIQELKQLMALHGGRFCNYYHRGTGGLARGAAVE